VSRGSLIVNESGGAWVADSNLYVGEWAYHLKPLKQIVGKFTWTSNESLRGGEDARKYPIRPWFRCYVNLLQAVADLFFLTGWNSLNLSTVKSERVHR
jgi:hypothetical protein